MMSFYLFSLSLMIIIVLIRKLRLLQHKNRGKNKRVAKKQLLLVHLSMGKKRSKTKPTQRHMGKATAKLRTQIRNPRKRHNARASTNQTKIHQNPHKNH